MKNHFQMMLLAAPLGMLLSSLPVTARAAEQQSDQSAQPSGAAPAAGSNQPTQPPGLHPFAQSILTAADPSAAVEAYAESCHMCPDHTPVQRAYVQRMTEFALPELAESQARLLVSSGSDDGLAWGVVAYMDARRGQSPAALAEIVEAVKLLPDDEFVQRTAGQIAAWYDAQADQSQMPDSLKSALASLKADLGSRPAFTDAYRDALESFRTAPAGATSGAPSQSGYPATPSASAEAATGGDDLAASPYAYVEPNPYVYVEPNVIYTNPYVFGPSSFIVSPWWPSVFFIDHDHFFFHHGFVHDFDRDDFRFHRFDGVRHFDRDHARFDHDFDRQRITGQVDHGRGSGMAMGGPPMTPHVRQLPPRSQPPGSSHVMPPRASFHTVMPPRPSMPPSRNLMTPGHAPSPAP